jgi:hypothetical protein
MPLLQTRQSAADASADSPPGMKRLATLIAKNLTGCSRQSAVQKDGWICRVNKRATAIDPRDAKKRKAGWQLTLPPHEPKPMPSRAITLEQENATRRAQG